MTTNSQTDTTTDTTETPSATYTLDQVATMIAAERRKVEEKHSKAQAEVHARLSGEIEELRSQLDVTGRGPAAAERAALDRKLAQTEKLLAERDADRKRLEGELQKMRVDASLGDALNTRQLMPEARRYASIGFMADAKIEFDAAGRVAYVDVNGQTFASVESAFDAWMQKNGSAFTRDAKATPYQHSQDKRPLWELPVEELIAQSNRASGRP